MAGLRDTKVPGGAQDRRNGSVLPTLSLAHRTAFVAAAAQRVMPVLEDVLGKQEACGEALELCWRVALGLPVDRARAEALAQDCEELVDRLYDEDESGAPLRALNAISYALQSALT